MTSTKLEKLLIGEVSGVDDPAHEIPGWMVAKAATPPASDAAGDSGFVDKIKALITKGGEPTGESEIEMTKDELVAVLEEREVALVEKMTEAVAKSVEVPAAGEATPAAEVTPPAPAETTTTTAETLSVEDIQKGIAEALAPYAEALEKTLDRLAAVETALAKGARMSLNGQETQGEGTEAPPTVRDGIAAALKNRGGTPSGIR